MRYCLFFLVAVQFVLALPGLAVGADSDPLQVHLDALRAKGAAPVDFVVEALDSVDLLIFDDALHTAVEPFAFYEQLLRDPRFRERARYVFLELAPVNHQPALDAYLAAEDDDPSLLYPLFQDVGDLGLTYATYFDLLRTVREVNATLTEDERLRVVAVSDPTRWCEIHTYEDLEIDRRNYLYRDYLMYSFILDELGGFESGRKGIFLTNTRHAYTGIRRADGDLYWNCGTFFRQRHPGRTMSIRIHNASLYFARRKSAEETGAATSQGLEGIEVHWVRVADGLWDSAFDACRLPQVAVPLAGTPFGEAPYIGNHMLDAAPGQTMADAYDAVISLAPLEKMHKTAKRGDLYTPEFRREAARRYRIMYTPEQIEENLAADGVETVEELIATYAESEPEQPLPQAQAVGPLDAWRDR